MADLNEAFRNASSGRNGHGSGRTTSSRPAGRNGDSSSNRRPTRSMPQTSGRRGDPHTGEDPAKRFRGAGFAPNFGNELLPHVLTFQGIVSTGVRNYRPSDEAIKKSWADARYMLNDPAIQECLEQRMRSTALLGWHLEPANQKDSRQKDVCEKLTTIIKQTPRLMQYRESLLRALWYGKYAVQHRFRWKPIDGQMRVCIDRWLPVNGDKLVYRWDDGSGECQLDQIGIRVNGMGILKTSYLDTTAGRIRNLLPTDYGLAYFLEDWERPLLAVHRHMIEDGEWEDPVSAGRITGVGIRHRIFWAWYQKQECLNWLMVFLERCAQGIEIWYYPWGNEQALEKITKAANESVGQGRAQIFVPRPIGEEMAYGVERIEPGMGGAEALKSILTEYWGWQIKRYILGQTLTTEAASTGLGSNLASIHLDTYLQIVRYDALNLEETLTTDLLRPLILYNFPQYADIPISFKIETESPDVEGKLQAWRQAYEMGCRLKEKDLMGLIGTDEPSKDDRVLQAPEHTQAARDTLAAQANQVGLGGAGGQDPGTGTPKAPGGMPTVKEIQKKLSTSMKMRYSKRLGRVVYESSQKKQANFFAGRGGREIFVFDGDRTIRYRRRGLMGDRICAEAI